MKRLLFATLLLFSFKGASAQPKDYLTVIIQQNSKWVTAEVKRHINGNRYMEGDSIGVSTTLKGWEGVPVTLYRYKVRDTKQSPWKYAEVYLADASFERIARWVISACWLTRHKVTKALVDQTLINIDTMSNAQFPVMGIVYENMDGKGEKPWLFMDGVTVFPKAPLSMGVLSQSVIDSCTHLSADRLKTFSGTYGRIASTTREQYYQNGGKKNVGHTKSDRNMAWLEVVRDLYKKALSSDENELLTAWAKEKLK